MFACHTVRLIQHPTFGDYLAFLPTAVLMLPIEPLSCQSIPMILQNAVRQYPVREFPAASSIGFEQQMRKEEKQGNTHEYFQNVPAQNHELPTPLQKTPLIAAAGKRRRKYLKKNSQANISNQAFSFASTPKKSLCFLRLLLGNLEETQCRNVCSLYYSYAKIIRKTHSRYLNKRFLRDISTGVDETSLVRIRESAEYSEQLSLREFCRFLRVLMHHFLTNLCPMMIVCSKRLAKQTRKANLQRRRDIIRYLSSRTSREQ